MRAGPARGAAILAVICRIGDSRTNADPDNATDQRIADAIIVMMMVVVIIIIIVDDHIMGIPTVVMAAAMPVAMAVMFVVMMPAAAMPTTVMAAMFGEDQVSGRACRAGAAGSELIAAIAP